MHARAISSAAITLNPTRPTVFRSLKQQAGRHIAAIGPLLKKSPGETLFVEGDEMDSVYEVVHGMLRLYKLLPDGRRQITGFLSAGNLLGSAPEGVCLYTAEAITEVGLCRYKRAAFERLIDEVPGFAKRLLAVTSHELRAAQDQMLLLGRKTAAERVASFLLLLADRQGGDNTDEVDVPMNRNDIADHLGLTVETVSRTFTRLKQDGLIALPTPTQIRIRKRDRLEVLAAGEGDGRR
jgi:CRP/FNR family transcriptional regulator